MKDCGAKGRISTVGKSQLTHCVHGHEFTPENTRITPIGHRSCRACEKTRAAIRARGTKEAA
jgi:predicted transcriptional regulator